MANNQQIAICRDRIRKEKNKRKIKDKTKTIMMTIKKYNYIENKSKNEILDPNENNSTNILFILLN